MSLVKESRQTTNKSTKSSSSHKDVTPPKHNKKNKTGTVAYGWPQNNNKHLSQTFLTIAHWANGPWNTSLNFTFPN